MLRQIVLIPNATKQIPSALLLQLMQILQEGNCTVRALEESRKILRAQEANIRFGTEQDVFSGAELILVLGGDGSILDAARRSLSYRIPIAGINLGRLGYLAAMEPDELPLLAQLLAGNGTVEDRFMLDVQILRNGSAMKMHTPALNDAVLSNGPVPKLLSFDLYCDGELAESCYADGVIAATPTGSTAYSLSAGGPVLEPKLECICATPICPQMTRNRPVIFGGDSVLEIRNIKTRSNTVYLTVDGQESVSLLPGDVIRIFRSAYTTRLVRMKKDGFLSALRRKLS